MVQSNRHAEFETGNQRRSVSMHPNGTLPVQTATGTTTTGIEINLIAGRTTRYALSYKDAFYKHKTQK